MERFTVDDISPVQFEFEGPDGVVYLLREASEDAALKYQQCMMAGAKVDPATNRATSIDVVGVVQAESVLVAHCLFAPNVGKDGKTIDYKKHPVDVVLVRTWTQRLVKALADKIKEISPELKRDVPKNSGSAGTGTSA